MSTQLAGTPTETAFLAAARAGDRRAFATLSERYRAELQLHCYRMLGSAHDAEDLVQETFLRAWSKRTTYRRRATFRTWLYGIATNACLDALRRRPKRLLPPDLFDASDPNQRPDPPTDLAWLEPFPDRLLDEAANEDQPEAKLLVRETTALAFLAAIQHLPPRQRAVLVLRDVLDWSAKEVAASLETTVASVNSALQRAHATLARHLPARDGDVTPAPPTLAASVEEQSLLESMIDAWERADASALAALLSEDARLVMPPTPSWYDGRDATRRDRRDDPLPSTGALRPLGTAGNDVTDGERDSEPISFVGRTLPEPFNIQHVTIEAGCERSYLAGDWSGALVVVEEGELEVECIRGTRSRFESGAILFFDSLPLKTLHNCGAERVLLIAVSRKGAAPWPPLRVR